MPENPAYGCVFEPENTKLFEESSQRFHLLEKSKLNLNLVDDAPSLDIVPWKLSVPAVRFDLASFKKHTTNPEIYKQLYLQLISEYPLSDFFFFNSATVLKQRKELLRRLYPQNELKKLLHVGFQTTVQYIQHS